MPQSSTATLMEAAAIQQQAVAAFNVITLEHAEAILSGAARAHQPVILQLSQNAIHYHGGKVGPMAGALQVLATEAPTPVALHLDHIEDRELLQQGVQAGFSSIMFDAGRLPYDANVAETAEVAHGLRSLGIFTEAELGYVGGKATQITSAHAPGVRTDPDQAAGYAAATGVDALAVAVGSSHAMTEQTAELDIALITRLRERVRIPLVLHGSSGVPDTVLQQAIRAGITKVNIGTALNIAFTGALRRSLDAHDTVDPRPHLDAARAQTASVVEQILAVIAAA